VWVLGSLAKRWTPATQPKGFDSPVLLATVQPKSELPSSTSTLVLLTFTPWNASLKVLGKRAQNLWHLESKGPA